MGRRERENDLIPRIVEMLQAIHSPDALGTGSHCVIHLTAEDEEELNEADVQHMGRPLAEQVVKEGARAVFSARLLGHDTKWDAEYTMVEDLTVGFKAGDGWLKRPEKEPSEALLKSIKYTNYAVEKYTDYVMKGVKLRLNKLERRIK